MRLRSISKFVCLGVLLSLLPTAVSAEPKELLWGDTHLHTNNSFDAYLNRNMSATPEVAYRYAMGYPVIHPYHRASNQGQSLCRLGDGSVRGGSPGSDGR